MPPASVRNAIFVYFVSELASDSSELSYLTTRMASTHALWLCAVKDKLKDIELACPGHLVPAVDTFLNSVQSFTQKHYSQAGVNHNAVLDELGSVRQTVRHFAGDEAALKEYLVSTVQLYLATFAHSVPFF